MKKFHNVGTSRTTGMEYTTSVIEAIGVEHKETTRNYDILAAVFSDVVKYMHDDGLINEVDEEASEEATKNDAQTSETARLASQ